MDYELSKNDMTTLRKNVVIVPAGGTRNLMPLSSMLIAHDIKIVVLLDGDDAGKIKKKQLTDKLLVNTLLVSDFLDVSEAEIEDIFPEDVYLKAVYEAYPDGLSSPITFTEDEMKISCITKRITKAFKRMGLNDFENWRFARIEVYVEGSKWPTEVGYIKVFNNDILFEEVRKHIEGLNE